MFGEDPAVAAAAHAPSADAIDRATRLFYRCGVSTTGRSELLEEIAKLIDAADAAADKERIGGHGVVHWHNTAERRMGQIVELEAVVRRRNVRIAELERELEELRRNGGANLLKAIDRANTAEAELAIAERKLEIADRQRREFLGHSRTANARRAEVERERDDARRRVAELESAGWGEVAERAAERLRAAERRTLKDIPSLDLFAELERRMIDGEAARRTLEENS